MIFLADMALAFELIALVTGTALLVYSCKEGIGCKAFAKTIAYITIALSILSILCTGYYSLRYWEDGYFQKPAAMGSKFRKPGRIGPKDKKYREERRIERRRAPERIRSPETKAPDTN